jgi:hypothetical protein
MKTIIASLLSVGIMLVLAGPSDAASKKRYGNYYYYYYYYYYGGLAQRFPSATPRQLRNAWAYDNPGHYYETDSNAFPVGSRGWWEMKRLEQGGRIR